MRRDTKFRHAQRIRLRNGNVAVVTTAGSAGSAQQTGGPANNNPFGLWVTFSGALGLAFSL
jgi:hypothetical protein